MAKLSAEELKKLPVYEVSKLPIRQITSGSEWRSCR